MGQPMQSMHIQDFHKVESPVKKSKKEVEAQRIKELRFSDVESACYKPASKSTLDTLHLHETREPTKDERFDNSTFVTNESNRKYLDDFVKSFCSAINDLLKPQHGLPAKTAESLADRFSKDTAGYLNFEEFKKLYAMAWFVQIDKINDAQLETLRQVFMKLDNKNTGRISKQDFKSMLDDKDFAWSVIHKLKNRI
jgi:Ca2+-binding EF-hand superfamily protein